MTERSKTEFIAIHCSATRPSQQIDVEDLRKWHKAKGWDDVGYHFVITRAGKVQPGRDEKTVGAHVEGFNGRSIGICLVGGVSEDDFTKDENNFTPLQMTALHNLLLSLRKRYPGAVIQGHRDFPNVRKACPSFDVKEWLRGMTI
jgi:N-acetylmuramoyl-L-alanine amidase